MNDARARRMRSVAREYAEKATRLSEEIDEFEDFLMNLDGKMEVSVESEVGTIKFGRYESSWRLLANVYIEDDFGGNRQEWRPVIDCGLRFKVAAAEISDELLRKIEESHRFILDDLDRALGIIEETTENWEG